MLRPRNIVVGYHGSEASRRALDAAVDLAGYGSALAVISVRPRHESGEFERPLDAAREQLLRRQIPARYVSGSARPPSSSSSPPTSWAPT